VKMSMCWPSLTLGVSRASALWSATAKLVVMVGGRHCQTPQTLLQPFIKVCAASQNMHLFERGAQMQLSLRPQPARAYD